MSTRSKVILIQAAIIAGLAVYFKGALPRIGKAQAASQTTEREHPINFSLWSMA